jgi:ATP-dependent Clp protease ATP-binding subunit ClpC
MARVADSLRKGAAGFRGRRPLATFLLLGPTGVGKTETAKAVSELFFPGSPMTRIDMSELGEAHTVARLLGAPPGYVGHEDGGQLTEPVRRRPYQLVLLDEIEKAHIDVLLALLPLLDEGRLTDGRGRTVDFTNTIVMMTSNLGADASASAKGGIGFGRAPSPSAGRGRDAALGAARGALPPELWNRIDEPLYFGRLSPSDVAEIARRMLEAIGRTLAEKQGLELEVDPSAIDALVRAGGYDAALGARPMRRVIGRLVEAKLASAILEGRVPPRARVRLSGEDADVRFSVEAAGALEAPAAP